MATNLELAKRMADFADGLVEFNHLPPLAWALVDRYGTVGTRPYLESFDPFLVGVRAVAEWAYAFAVPVQLDLSDAAHGTVNVLTHVTVAARRAEIKQGLLTGQYRTLEKSIGIGPVESGELVAVSAQQLLSAVREEAA